MKMTKNEIRRMTSRQYAALIGLAALGAWVINYFFLAMLQCNMPYKDPEKRREYARLWIATQRKAWFRDKSCAVCGSSGDLQLDHLDPTKKITHRIWSWASQRRSAELQKCQVLCKDCHEYKTTTGQERARRGEENSQAKLTANDVRQIRNLVAQKASKRAVAAQFGVGESIIRYICNGKRWSHIT